MSDNVSLSLDEYIKRQRRQTPRKNARTAAKNQAKGKPKARNQPARYYQAGGINANRGKNARVGAKVGRGVATLGAGGGFSRNRGQFRNKRNNNNRLNVVRKIRPVQQANPGTLDVRARRFGVPRRNATQARAGVVRNAVKNQQPRNQRNWKRNFNQGLVPRANIQFQQRNNSGRLARPKGNVRLQSLIRKRIKNARSLLAAKLLVTRNNPRFAPQKGRRQNPNLGLVGGGPQNRQLAQQKLNRAKLIRTRIRNNKLQRTGGGSLRNRGLSVDRNNIVRVRVANDFRQNYGGPPAPPSNYHHPASGMYSSSQYPPLPPNYGMGLPDPEFPPFTMHNTMSRPIDEIEVCRSSLDPNIQRKISVIQNRARNSNMSPARVMSDFKAPVSSSAMKLGDRFRMMMRQ